jgi:hypothetical protein
MRENAYQPATCRPTHFASTPPRPTSTYGDLRQMNLVQCECVREPGILPLCFLFCSVSAPLPKPRALSAAVGQITGHPGLEAHRRTCCLLECSSKRPTRALACHLSAPPTAHPPQQCRCCACALATRVGGPLPRQKCLVRPRCNIALRIHQALLHQTPAPATTRAASPARHRTCSPSKKDAVTRASKYEGPYLTNPVHELRCLRPPCNRYTVFFVVLEDSNRFVFCGFRERLSQRPASGLRVREKGPTGSPTGIRA